MPYISFTPPEEKNVDLMYQIGLSSELGKLGLKKQGMFPDGRSFNVSYTGDIPQKVKDRLEELEKNGFRIDYID